MLTKEQLLKPRIKLVDVDDGQVNIRAINAAYAMELRGKELHGADIFDVIAKSICDEQGNLFMSADEVGQMAIATLEQIIKGIFEFNALGEKAVAEAVDELKKTGDLTTNSPQV